MVALLVEDPQALHANKEYIKYLDWIVTNDINAYEYYLGQVADKKKQVLHWNCLSISNKLLEFIKEYSPAKEYDICMVGYPYPSRVDFMKQLKPLIPNLKIALIGDTWDAYNIGADTYKTMDEIETARIAMKSKITLLKHRTRQDLSGFPMLKPDSVNRGYTELCYKNIILIDNDRKSHSFGDNNVLWYSNPKECAERIKDTLANYNQPPLRDLIPYTYKERLMKILNCVRSPRHLIKTIC